MRTLLILTDRLSRWLDAETRGCSERESRFAEWIIMTAGAM